MEEWYVHFKGKFQHRIIHEPSP